MESKSKRKESYKRQRNLSPERRSRGMRRSSKSRERSLEYKNSREKEISAKRKYKGENNKHNESRQSKGYEPPSSRKGGHSTKESTEFGRKSQSSKAANTALNGNDERNKVENSKYCEIRQQKEYKDYDLKSRDRDPSPRQRSHYNRKNTDRRNSHSKEVVYKQINEMIFIERHHTRYVDRSTSGSYSSDNSTSGEVKYVHWCPQYINPDTRGHVRGGTSLLHHTCRQCRKLCFHLLGQPGTTRRCLACAGYKDKYIPDWYYHKRCKYCQ